MKKRVYRERYKNIGKVVEILDKIEEKKPEKKKTTKKKSDK